jgi:hypothetical protein
VVAAASSLAEVDLGGHVVIIDRRIIHKASCVLPSLGLRRYSR